MIIGLGFKARSGKDVVADYLVEKHGFTKQAFAGTLKEACGIIYSLTPEQLYGDLKEVKDPFWAETPRYILQKFGTECMRNGYDEDIWIDVLDRKIRGLKDVVVTDVRFPNEANAIKGWGGKLIRIDRPEAGATGGIVAHASETSLLDYKGWDYTIHNNETLEDLYRKAENLIQLLRSE